MEFKSKTLSNGLSIIGEVNKSARSAAVGFFVRTGSRDETPEVSGVSHFLEHMLFKGTDKLSALEVNEAFDRTGAQFNAFTSEENTVYYAAVLPEYLHEVTDLWTQLMRPSLRDDDFNMEKNVIKEEIAMYQDLPNFDVMDRCRTLHFGDHPCGNSVLGTNDSIDGMSAEQMRAYFDRRYAPNNVAASFAGNFDFDKICDLVESACSKWQQREAPRELTHHPGSNKSERLEKPNLVREHICLMSESVAAQDSQRFAAAVLATVIGDDVGSRFFWELTDKALAETAALQFGAMDGTGAFHSYIRCSTDNSEKVMQIVRDIFDSIAKDSISPEELTKAKNKILSALVIKNELSMGRLIDLGFNWTYLKEYRTISQDVEAIKAVTLDDVRAITKKFNLANFTQFSLGPQKTT